MLKSIQGDEMVPQRTYAQHLAEYRLSGDQVIEKTSAVEHLTPWLFPVAFSGSGIHSSFTTWLVTESRPLGPCWKALGC